MASAVLTGKVYYPKVLGEPREKYESQDKEWCFDFAIDEATKKLFKEKRCRNRIHADKKGDHDGNEFVKFQRDAIKADGEAAKPYEVVDIYGDAWAQDKLIGNGSLVNLIVAFSPRTSPQGEKFHKASVIKMQVVEHVPFGEGGPKVDFEFKPKDTEEWKSE